MKEILANLLVHVLSFSYNLCSVKITDLTKKNQICICIYPNRDAFDTEEKKQELRERTLDFLTNVKQIRTRDPKIDDSIFYDQSPTYENGILYYSSFKAYDQNFDRNELKELVCSMNVRKESCVLNITY